MPRVQVDARTVLFVPCCYAEKLVVCRASLFVLGAGAASTSILGWKLISALPACLELGVPESRYTCCPALSLPLTHVPASPPVCSSPTAKGCSKKASKPSWDYLNRSCGRFLSRVLLQAQGVCEGINWKLPTAQPVKNKKGIKAVYEVTNPQAWGIPHLSTELLCPEP